jgi:hypothetical protein
MEAVYTSEMLVSRHRGQKSVQMNLFLTRLYIYRMSKEERSVFWEVTVSVILSKKVYMYMCSIPNGFRDRAISLYRRATRHVLTDVGSGNSENILSRVLVTNNAGSGLDERVYLLLIHTTSNYT